MTPGNKRDSSGNIINNGHTAAQDSANQPNAANSSKPTRRFACTFDGCDKSYTRAEHLGRHQLNHNPKDIYHCDFPGCSRVFVRQDLCVRHRERHDAPPNKVGVVSSDDEDADSGTGTRRVGRPRLSSLNRNGSVARLNDQQMSHALPVDSEQNGRLSSGPITSVRNDFPSQVASPPRFANVRPQSGMTGNINGFSIDMLDQRTSQQPLATTNDNQNYALPALEFNESPASVRDEFTAWLFDEQFPNPTGGPFLSAAMNNFGSVGINDFMSFGTMPMFTDYANDGLPTDLGLEAKTSSTSDFEIVTADDIGWISSSKRSKLIDLMRSRFIDAENTDITSLRLEVFSGEDADAEDHILSLRSMQIYLGSYWKHFHRQMPILHQPTFSADSANDLLVLAVMAIGASQLGSRHGRLKTTQASKFATFVAWHLRWQIFMHVDFRPPAKLWVFQALLLLEVYEKLGSTRQMHERAHVHSATMINLMRRGTTLVGEDETARRTPNPTTPDEAWHRWIETESTRRAAFAAFVIDAQHAVMFGHAAIMVVHELRLPLPCDDALWSATSAAEVGRVHASLHTHGIKPTTFIEGLKRTLTGKKVKTNHFGRTILMAGLLSITWHLHQRDLQVSSLGASSSLGMPGIWREALAKSFDFWKRDFDESMSHMKNSTLPWQQITTSEDRDACSAADVLHHLSHITLHVDFIECQIFTGAHKLFGRSITRNDYERAKHKMLDWCKTPGARSAALHALQILRPILMHTVSSSDFYCARDDHLLNRGWAIYHSLLVLFAYGYALDGPMRPYPVQLPTPTSTSKAYTSPDFNTWSGISETVFLTFLEDARVYLNSLSHVKSPDDFRLVQSGRNRLAGLLGLFANSFRDSRWELLQEGSARLERAVQLLRDGEQAKG